MMTNPSDGYYGEAGTRNPEEPASAAYLPSGHFDTPEGSVYIPSEAELDGNPTGDETFYADRIPTTMRADIYALILYNWQAEEADFYQEVAAATTPDAKKLIEDTHIFSVMLRLGKWVNF